MGGGGYSISDRSVRAASKGYATKSIDELFETREHDWRQKGMDPKGAKYREARDSDEHPESVPIIFALDVTGSMLRIPHQMLKDGLPTMMGTIIQQGVKDPQLMFMAIGDHECDSAPLQVGQFESSDELLDKWLTSVWLEGHGGGNEGESYLLVWYFASCHISTDHWVKRKKKGFLFTVGDEPTLKQLPGKALDEIMGPAQNKSMTASELLAKAQETWYVYHFHVKEGSKGSWQETIDEWSQLLGPGLIVVDDHKDIPIKMAEIIIGIKGGSESTEDNLDPIEEPQVPFEGDEREEEIL